MCKIQSLGIDLGSTSAKIVAVDEQGRMAWHVLEPTSPYVEDQVEGFLAQARQQIGSLEGIPLIATGYNRRRVPQATNHITEITCHARGIFREMRHGGTLIDIGGQDSKCIRINPDGKVIDFAMNDKCAAGTGRFLENIAQRLGLPLEKIGEIALGASEETSISSTCTVFAETEIISLIAQGVSIPIILRSLHRTLIKRLVAMIHSVGLASPLMMSGGVVRNPAIRQLLQAETGESVMLPKHPQLMGAYGAALSGVE